MLLRRANTEFRLCHACSPSSLMKVEPGQRIRRENPVFCPREALACSALTLGHCLICTENSPLIVKS